MLLLTTVATLLALAPLQTAYDGPPLPKLAPEITRAEIEQHVRTLASDALLGRATGSPESVTAAHYLAEELKGCGVAPAGDEGGYLQRVPFSRPGLVGTPSLELATSDGSKPALVYDTDWRFSKLAFAKRTLGVAVARSAEEIPKEGLEEKALFLDESDRAKQREWLKSSGHVNGQGLGLLVVPAGSGMLPRRPPTLALEGALLESFRAGKAGSLTLEVRYEDQEQPAYNVVGILRGEGPGASKAIVLSAHYDHLGGAPAKPGDTQDHINNGADDDASGCSVVLELAGALAREPHRAHTIVFLLATGEEIGLVGTDYQIAHPAVPLEDTLANLNFEMLGRPDPLVGGAGKMWLTGWDETNLGAALEAAGIPIAVDPRPSENFYQRSDNIAYVHKGVVGQTFSTYNMHRDYHTVKDEADAIDFEHLTSCAQTALRAVDLVASGKVTPVFTPKSAPPDTKKPQR
ncbi:MAG: M28 family peptidase [Planctomycetes bacterium]|nr:M28 family peptidase [Planctomycetota bacterium]